MGKAVGEGGLEEEEQEGLNLSHESSPSLETNLERKRHVREVANKNQMNSNHCPSHIYLYFSVKSERTEFTHKNPLLVISKTDKSSPTFSDFGEFPW